MNVYLIGYRCTGKTTIGKLLSKKLNLVYIDTDQMIESKINMSISEFVLEKNWSEFRKIEKAMLLKTKKNQKAIISTGGGIILDPENRTFIKKHGYSCWLTANINTILERFKKDEISVSQRPSFTSSDLESETRELLKIRNPLYEDTSHLKIDTSLLTPENIVNTIKRNLQNVW